MILVASQANTIRPKVTHTYRLFIALPDRLWSTPGFGRRNPDSAHTVPRLAWPAGSRAGRCWPVAGLASPSSRSSADAARSPIGIVTL